LPPGGGSATVCADPPTALLEAVMPAVVPHCPGPHLRLSDPDRLRVSS
jgi:hypothetical protein